MKTTNFNIELEKANIELEVAKFWLKMLRRLDCGELSVTSVINLPLKGNIRDVILTKLYDLEKRGVLKSRFEVVDDSHIRVFTKVVVE